jgi:hypothetical protein
MSLAEILRSHLEEPASLFTERYAVYALAVAPCAILHTLILRTCICSRRTLLTTFPLRRVNFDRAVRDLDRVTRHKSLLPGDKLFSLGEPSVELYLVESGSVNLRVLHLNDPEP